MRAGSIPSRRNWETNYRNAVFASQASIESKDDLQKFTQRFAQQNGWGCRFVMESTGDVDGRGEGGLRRLANRIGISETPTAWVVTPARVQADYGLQEFVLDAGSGGSGAVASEHRAQSTEHQSTEHRAQSTEHRAGATSLRSRHEPQILIQRECMKHREHECGRTAAGGLAESIRRGRSTGTRWWTTMRGCGRKTIPRCSRIWRAENAWCSAVMAGSEDLQKQLYNEMLSHIKETDVPVPLRDRPVLVLLGTEQGEAVTRFTAASAGRWRRRSVRKRFYWT